MTAFIARLLLLFTGVLRGMFAVWSNNVRHWLPPQLDFDLVVFLCGSVRVYWLGRMLIEGLEDFVAC
jgi:hypothetical protein